MPAPTMPPMPIDTAATTPIWPAVEDVVVLAACFAVTLFTLLNPRCSECVLHPDLFGQHVIDQAIGKRLERLDRIASQGRD